MSLDIINAQGAQVTALQEAIGQRDALITLLAARLPGGVQRYTRSQQATALEGVEGVTWKVLKDGTLVITVARK